MRRKLLTLALLLSVVATMRHTSDFVRTLLPVDIYLGSGSYGWSGILNQPSGTVDERMQALNRNPALWINPDIFPQLMAAREASFAESLAAMRLKSQTWQQAQNHRYQVRRFTNSSPARNGKDQTLNPEAT